jgi:hypothetical protein
VKGVCKDEKVSLVPKGKPSTLLSGSSWEKQSDFDYLGQKPFMMVQELKAWDHSGSCWHVLNHKAWIYSRVGKQLPFGEKEEWLSHV